MIRRTAATVSAAALLVLVPTAAFGYGADDYTDRGTVSDTTPTAGEAISVSVQGPASAPVTLTVTSNPASLPDSAISIAGTRSLTKTTNAAGQATFSVTINAGGSYAVVATDATSGAVLSTQSLAVAAVGAAAADPAAASGGRTTAAGGGLAVTGSDALPIGLGAGALLVAGAGAVLVSKRRAARSA